MRKVTYEFVSNGDIFINGTDSEYAAYVHTCAGLPRKIVDQDEEGKMFSTKDHILDDFGTLVPMPVMRPWYFRRPVHAEGF